MFGVDVSIHRIPPGKIGMYFRPGGWRFDPLFNSWVQRDNAYCGCPSIARCKCKRTSPR